MCCLMALPLEREADESITDIIFVDISSPGPFRSRFLHTLLNDLALEDHNVTP